MEKDTTIQDKKKQKIDAIEPSDEHLTSRAGLALFAQYLQSIQLMPVLEKMFASMRKNKKGIAVTDFFLQMLCFFMDGSSRRLSWFDHLKRDESYAALLACRQEELAVRKSLPPCMRLKDFLQSSLLCKSTSFVICCRSCSSGD